MSDIAEVIIEGRIVGGHPMDARQKKDDKTKQPLFNADGSPRMTTFIAMAVPKGGETHWNQTAWGQQIWNVGVNSWPNGEYNRTDFAWKVEDGDSQIPNRKGKKNADREGYPGHWIVKASTELAVKCHHVNKYDPMQQIQDKNEIKPGDYGRLFITVKGNGSTQSPGVYVNPVFFSLDRAGQLIVLEGGPSAADVFSGATTPPPATTSVQPAPDLLTPSQPGQAPAAPTPPAPSPTVAPEPTYTVDGHQYTHSQLQAAGWTEQQILALQ